MSDWIRGVLLIFLVAGAIIGAIAWINDRPDALAWQARTIAPLVAALAMGLMLWGFLRRDHAPNYLRTLTKHYFYRGGVCFSLSAIELNGIAYLLAHFQNQFERPCRVQIMVRPSRGLLFGRAEIDPVLLDFECGPAAFGMARTPLQFAARYQGSQQSCDVGASVKYPEGRGQRLRFRDGITLSTNARMQNTLMSFASIIAIFGGMFIFYRPARAIITLPLGAGGGSPYGDRTEVRTLWELDDPPLTGIF